MKSKCRGVKTAKQTLKNDQNQLKSGGHKVKNIEKVQKIFN